MDDQDALLATHLISDDFTNVDAELGGDDIDAFLKTLDEDQIFSHDNIMNHIRDQDRPQVREYIGRYDPETESEIDPSLTCSDMLTLLYAEVKRKKIAGHHLESMNSFYRVGIKQIATRVFVNEWRIKNVRDKTDEDRAISDIVYKVEFKDIYLTPPTTVKYKSGTAQMLTPGMARIKNLTYSVQMHIDADVTATAIFRDGSTKTRTGEIRNHRTATIPCMVGSELCNTFNCSRATLKELEEDPNAVNGQFIVKGGEWSVENLENITNNTFHVYKNEYKTELARGTFLSKPGDAFENAYQIILRYLNNGAITIEVTATKFNKFEIPYYIIFRALGMTRDVDIVNNIVYGVNNDDPITKTLMEYLAGSFAAPVDKRFSAIKDSTDPVTIVAHIAQKITEGINPTAAAKDDNIAKYLNNNILSTIDKFMLPHLGTAPSMRIKKLRFLAHLINKLLCVYMGVIEPTDRDSYENKRVFSAGTSMAKSFKTDFNFTVIQEIRKHLSNDFKTTPFSDVNLAESVKASINSEDLERMLIQSITSGNKTITVKRNQEVVNRVSSSLLYYKNDMNVKATMSSINTPNTSASKQNERADIMRRVHPTYVGFIDVSQSKDSGEGVGLNKQMCAGASICGASSSFLIKESLENDPDVIALDDVQPEDITARKLAKVFVNGDWVGCCEEAHKLVHRYRMARRHGDIHRETTIVWKLLIREVVFWTDVGRLMRMLVIVYNNIEEYTENWRNGDRTAVFKQWIKLTREHIIGLQSGAVTVEDLKNERVLEYISPEEQENTLIAQNIDILRADANNVTRQYTHCDIDQAIFGIVSLASPLANTSSATRITYYTNHRKQAAGWFALNFPFRMDKNTTLQHYCEKPLISAVSDSLTYPTCNNTIVALAIYGGYNQEDSVMANQSSVDCGAFNASYYNCEKTELDKAEQFGNPDYARTLDIKKDATYEFVKNGFIVEGTLAQKNYVLAVKTAKITKPTNDFLYIDKSIVYKADEPAYIERVVVTRNDEDAMIAKIKTRASRPLGVGDKVSSRTGNKGIVSIKIPRCDMPYCEDGLVPDLIVNPHSIPTRMAINQLIECALGTLAAKRGAHIDATSFIDPRLDAAIAALKEVGIEYGGHRRMYNGMTGEWFDTLIFIGPTTYQRLQKFVIDEQYSIYSGPTSPVTRQPLDGRTHDGGLRLGEMERDVICAHGDMRALHEKFYTDSDGATIPICRVCGERAVVNEKFGIYRCKKCDDGADIVNVKSSWVSNLFWNEASAMNVKMSFELNPHTYSRNA